MSKKDSHMYVRVSESDKEMFEEAARTYKGGVPLSLFIRMATHELAKRILEEKSDGLA